MKGDRIQWSNLASVAACYSCAPFFNPADKRTWIGTQRNSGLPRCVFRGHQKVRWSEQSLPSLIPRISDLHVHKRRLAVLPFINLLHVVPDSHRIIVWRSRRLDDLPVSATADEFDRKCICGHGVILDGFTAKLFITVSRRNPRSSGRALEHLSEREEFPIASLPVWSSAFTRIETD